MKAITIFKQGGPEVLELATHPDPEPGPGEVRIQIKANGLNHLDLWMRGGLDTFPIHLPRILGSDGSGIVEKLGAGVTDFAPGDGVMINPVLSCGTCTACTEGREMHCADFCMRGEHVDGLGAELVVMPAKNLFKKPDFMSFEEAASAPVIFLTAHRMVASLGHPRPGDFVVVQGATSGIGVASIQVAKAEGARVIAVSRKPQATAQLQDLGAEFVVNDQEAMLALLKEKSGKAKAAVVVEHVGAVTWPTSMRALGIGGRLVTCGATTGHQVKLDLRHLFFKHQQILGSTMGGSVEFKAVRDRLAQKVYRPVVDKVFEVAEVGMAHEYLEAASQIGKVVVRW